MMYNLFILYTYNEKTTFLFLLEGTHKKLTCNGKWSYSINHCMYVCHLMCCRVFCFLCAGTITLTPLLSLLPVPCYA